MKHSHLPITIKASAVNDEVGLILNELQELDLIENTVVIFLSGNGGPEKDYASANGLLRGGKRSLFEGGIRVPFAIQWPKQIKANTEYTERIISLHIFATVAANVQGIAKPKNKLDGVDLVPFLTGTKQGSPHEFLFWRQYDKNNYTVVHQPGLKEIILKDTNVAMYDLKKDIGEEKNVSDKNKNLFQRMERERKKWEATTIPPAFYGLNQEEKYEESKSEMKN